MIAWRVTGNKGWVEQRLVGSQLKKNVIDSSDYGYRHAQFIEQVPYKDSGLAFDQD
jgi:hypothetical protein